MSEEESRLIARRIFCNYNSCNYIQFFGGEPSLNMPAVRAFFNEVDCMFHEGIITHMPNFGIVTNGASRNAQEMVDFCVNHNIGVTVSLDGCRSIHDILRPDAQGNSSFDQAIKTIELLLKIDKVPVAIETVYTAFHIDKNFSIVDLIIFLNSLGVKKVIFHTAYPPAPISLCPFNDSHIETLIKYHIDAIDFWFDNLINKQSNIIDIYFKDILGALLQGAGIGVAKGGCPAGVRDFAIGIHGNTYLCHLLYKIPQFYIGNIISDDLLSQRKMLPLNTYDLVKCKDCFARYWCQPCGALNFNWGDAWIPPQRECMLRKAVLFRIAELAFKHLIVPANGITEPLRKTIYGDS